MNETIAPLPPVQVTVPPLCVVRGVQALSLLAVRRLGGRALVRGQVGGQRLAQLPAEERDTVAHGHTSPPRGISEPGRGLNGPRGPAGTSRRGCR
jgi:hypothetical protein